MKSIEFRREVPVNGKFDVVVCGGGPAGFIAAIAAAREGARTALIERHGFFGGLATAGYVTPISVFSYNGKRSIGGIPWEFVERLEGMGGAIIEEPLNNISFDPELYKLCAERMVRESGAVMLTNTVLVGAEMEGKRISSVVISNADGLGAVEGDVFIDATGMADIALWAGVPMLDWHDSVPMQPASMCFILSGVDTSSPMISKAMHHNMQGVNCHCLEVRDKLIELSQKEELPSFGGPWFCSVLHDGSVAVNITRASLDATNAESFNEGEDRLREDVFTFARILKENFPEFRNSYVSGTIEAGARETRHIKGIHTITADEFLSAYRYEDSVSRSSHPIDIHSPSGESQKCMFLEKTAYVPYRSMIAEGFPNLIVAGRTISASCEAFASIRVQASCMGIGQAAGVAAAMTGKGDVSKLDARMLSSHLASLGAELD